MTISYTALLGLAQPVTGTETGQWGTVVNDEITALLEDAVANAASISVTAGNVTLSTTNGSSNQARMSTLIITGTPGTTRNVVAPSQAKIYVVINQSDGAVVIKGAATSGVTIGAGQTAQVAWNGSDFVEIGNYVHGNFVVNGNLSVNGDSTLGNAGADTTTINGQVIAANSNISKTTTLSASAPALAWIKGATYTDTGTAGGTTQALAPFTVFSTPTLSTSNIVTYTDAATVYIAGAPAAAGSATITNPYSLYVAAGNAYFGASVSATTLDLTNLEVTNIKAKDGTASMTLADSTGVVTFSKATVIETTDNTNAALRITQLGTGNAILVEDSANPDSSPFVVTAIGNVGIGTTSPIALAANYTTVDIRGTTGGALRFGNATDSAYIYSDSNETNLSTATNKPLLFGISTTETMRLTSTGLKASIAGTNADPVFSYTSDTNTGIFFPAADKLGFTAGGGSDQMVLTSTGLGIGTNNPGAKLDVDGTVRAQIAGGGTGRYLDIGSDGSGTTRFFNNYAGGGDFGFVWKIGASDRMTLDASGNLLLGTTTTVNKLTVFGTSNQFASITSLTGGSTQVGINLNPSLTASEAAANPAQASIYAVDSNYSANIIFANKATGAVGNALTERARITSGGYFKASDNGTYNNLAGTYHELYQSTVETAVLVSAVNASFANNILQLNAARNTTNNSFYALSYYNSGAGAYKLRVADSGAIATAGSISLGTVTPATSGIGVQFPATQSASSDANTLDDYEEGTFTATLKGSTTDPTTPVTTTGYYTKIGNLINVVIQFSNVTTTGAAGEAYATGLPFTASASSSEVGSVMCYQFDFNGLTSVSCYVGASTTNLYPYMSGNNSAWSAVLHNAGTSRYLWMSATYRAA